MANSALHNVDGSGTSSSDPYGDHLAKLAQEREPVDLVQECHECQAPQPHHLVELTPGPWQGNIHRTETITPGEAHRRNHGMSGTVIEWQLVKNENKAPTV